MSVKGMQLPAFSAHTIVRTPSALEPRHRRKSLVPRSASGLLPWEYIHRNRTLHAPALPRAKNNEMVVDSKPTSQDAPCASTGARQKHREGSQSVLRLRMAPQRERFNMHESRRGFDGEFCDSHGAATRAFQHARNPQRVRRRVLRFARRHNESVSTRMKLPECWQTSFGIRTAPQLERFDTHETRRGLADDVENSHGATTRAIRHARNLQRVGKRALKFAQRHNKSDSTRTKPAEGSPPRFAKPTPA